MAAGSSCPGRTRDIIVLPNGFNVYPEDIENALRIAGIRDSVVLETSPGRIEAIVLAPGTHGLPQGGDLPGGRAGGLAGDAADVRARIDAAVKAANGRLGPNQRVAGWRLWPDEDFPRTHTLKVKRDRVRAWAAVEAPLPVKESRRLVRDRHAGPDRLERGRDRFRAGVRRVRGDQAKKTAVAPDDADDEPGVRRELDQADAAGHVGRLLLGRGGGGTPGCRTRR